MSDVKTVAERLAAACADVTMVAPDRKNPRDGYDYASVHLIADIARKALAKHGLAIIPSDTTIVSDEEIKSTRGSSGRRVVVRTTWHITGAMPEGDSPVVIVTTGEANDYSDKAQGKAQQYARKQALISALCLSTGDDPEADSPSGRVESPAAGRLTTLISLFAGNKARLGEVMREAGVESARLGDEDMWATAVEAARNALAAPPDPAEAITEKQRRALEAAAKKSGIGHDGLKKLVAHLFNIDSTTKIPAEQFDALLGLVESGATPEEEGDNAA